MTEAKNNIFAGSEDRRTGDRRKADQSFEGPDRRKGERRSGEARRKQERRSFVDRRGATDNG